MERIIITKSGREYILKRARKYTSLFTFINGEIKLHQKWETQDLELSLGDFEAQVDFFEESLK